MVFFVERLGVELGREELPPPLAPVPPVAGPTGGCGRNPLDDVNLEPGREEEEEEDVVVDPDFTPAPFVFVFVFVFVPTVPPIPVELFPLLVWTAAPNAPPKVAARANDEASSPATFAGPTEPPPPPTPTPRGRRPASGL